MGRTCLVARASAAVADAVAGAAWRIVGQDDTCDAIVAGGDIADIRRLSPAPLLALAAPGSDSDGRAAAFAAGADDVAPCPCGPAELIARLEALYRRRALLRCADLVIDLAHGQALRGGRALALRPREYRLLRHLAEAAGRPVDRAALLAAVWRLRADPGTNVVEVHVSRLRATLDRGHARPLLHTVAGRGYALADRPPCATDYSDPDRSVTPAA